MQKASDIFFVVRLNKLLKRLLSCRWCGTSWRSCDGTVMVCELHRHWLKSNSYTYMWRQENIMECYPHWSAWMAKLWECCRCRWHAINVVMMPIFVVTGRHGISNQRQLVCFFQQLIQANTREYSKAQCCGHFVMGIHRWWVYFTYKGSVMRKTFPCHDVIM